MQAAKGYCNALDIAGGDHADFKVRLANTIDEATVKKILGDRTIFLPEFLELMCEDDHRATPESKQAILKDGRYLVYHACESVNWEGWVFRRDAAPVEQNEQMRRIDAVVSEVLHWQRQRAKRRLNSEAMSGTPGF